MKYKKGISVCIATHNEEANIARCLASVIDFVDEVIIVDGESTDKTGEIAKSFGKKVRVFSEKNPPMFHQNKQKAIEKASYEWILQLDADEDIPLQLREEILSLSNAKKTEHVAYWIPRLNYFLGKPLRKGGQYPDYTIRFYKNGHMYFPCETVHEQVAVKNEKDTIGFLQNPMQHYPYPNFSMYLIKWDRYCDLEADILYKQGVRANIGTYIKYVKVEPLKWFLLTYIRHKAFMDGFPGFVFSFFSALRFIVIYIKLYEKK
jgi:glycosyltransferase involved in cell wall biosynthesis